MNITSSNILKNAVARCASDIFIIAGLPLSYKLQGEIVPLSEDKLSPEDTDRIIREIFTANENRGLDTFLSSGDADFSLSLNGVGRFRVSAYRQRSSLAAVIRVVGFELPDSRVLGIPENVMTLHKRTKGLILVTGPAGSGKSTTLACLIDRINSSRSCHIMTLEDPIEYIHRHKKSVVSQREIPGDSTTYVKALKTCLRQSPDVILIGEMRDIETINIALTAAETGHLVLSTLHTMGVANTVDRIIDVFPAAQQHQVRLQLSLVLQAVVSQQLVPTVTGGRTAAFEVMCGNTAIQNLIRDNKLHQISSVMQSGAGEGMQTMDEGLLQLYKGGRITRETALSHSKNPEAFEKQL
ncbi:MAG: type IV pilus twitching motility protein PilT [Eubacteriales bacterium]